MKSKTITSKEILGNIRIKLNLNYDENDQLISYDVLIDNVESIGMIYITNLEDLVSLNNLIHKTIYEIKDAQDGKQ